MEDQENCEHANVDSSVLPHTCFDCGAEFHYCDACSQSSGGACYHMPPVCPPSTEEQP
jgi:hypothetical protein